MKYYLAFAAILLINSLTHAQETVKRSGIVAGVIDEYYNVLKSDKKIRQGPYKATFRRITLATGSYNNGKRTARWNFYNSNGSLVQAYDYDADKIIFTDTADTRGMKYYLDITNRADTIIAPIKIGGSFYGNSPLVVAHNELIPKIREDFPGVQKATCTHILTVNEFGAIVAHHIKVSANNSEKTYIVADKNLDPDISRFVPAKINGKPVMSKVTLMLYISLSGAVTRTY